MELEKKGYFFDKGVLTIEDIVEYSDIYYEEVYHPERMSMSTPGAIDIKFVDKDTKETGNAKYTGQDATNWYTHPAFTFGTQELAGVWVAKFEMSPATGSTCAVTPNEANCDITTFSPEIKPSARSWIYARVGTYFTAIQNRMNGSNGTTTYGIKKSDTHMMKNTEWGAATFLTQSKYGKYGNPSYDGANKDVYVNNSSSAYTGRSLGSPLSSYGSSSTSTYGTYSYDGIRCTSDSCGGSRSYKTSAYGASTTGTIYGVYDMAGGSYDNVMAVLRDSAGTDFVVGESGFSGKDESGADVTSTYSSLKNFSEKYYDVYPYSTDRIDYSRYIPGDATFETKNWYYSTAMAVYNSNPFYIRGGCYPSNGAGEIYSFMGTSGVAYYTYSVRAVLVEAE